MAALKRLIPYAIILCGFFCSLFIFCFGTFLVGLLLPLFVLIKRRHPLTVNHIAKKKQSWKTKMREWFGKRKKNQVRCKISTRKQCNHHKVNLLKIEFTFRTPFIRTGSRHMHAEQQLNMQSAHFWIWALFNTARQTKRERKGQHMKTHQIQEECWKPEKNTHHSRFGCRQIGDHPEAACCCVNCHSTVTIGVRHWWMAS